MIMQSILKFLANFVLRNVKGFGFMLNIFVIAKIITLMSVF